ncbi:NADPH-dependent F420 reductase [Stutzerimonas kirkiae]|uniref:NADPH-dependent F420 reductase n=1 Tax=Stutzerimonas kirkiae TaxID=2211392 RepID=A0A4V2KDF7_9GAMM|nr:NAD(P)-binding domain-containing protein [Stutzerimonas kirkiae]TBU99207.1 NADPH-dependent F420 reductase [Stutzerimonas kirkiae]TBV06333.1 NADPH-dependent F420 reductase [Stutzerimonas kirkiae]TBV07535.1 NADPH-dependent F420 reductase [Stutzerimonas kirkiae]TBV15776.1 NADPH-dependent F420 reductase [Stutzerimonas kirkiae]
MDITIIGTGNMGSAFVQCLSKAGHRVTVTGRETEQAEALAAAHKGVSAAPVAQALGLNEVIILATGHADAIDALKSLGDVRGKVVIDITNPLTADYMGLAIGHSTSSAEEIAKAVPGIELVKGFNTLLAEVLIQGPKFPGGQTAPVFLASDSERARQTAKALAESMGFSTIDAGELRNARYLEPLGGLNIYLRYGTDLGKQIAPTWIRR